MSHLARMRWYADLPSSPLSALFPQTIIFFRGLEAEREIGNERHSCVHVWIVW